MLKWFLLLVIYSSFVQTWAQQVVFTNKNGKFLEGTELWISLEIDEQQAIELRTLNFKLDLSKYKVDHLLKMRVNGQMIDDYYNEYLPSQLNKLDTIELFQTRMISEATPRFFLKMDYDLDSSIVHDATWFRYFMDESPMDSTFRFCIYHSHRLTKKQNTEIQRIKESFCSEVGVDGNTISVIDRKENYTTARFNFFNQRTIISKEFIKRQNTSFMKRKAEEYSLVLLIEIVWNNPTEE